MWKYAVAGLILILFGAVFFGSSYKTTNELNLQDYQYEEDRIAEPEIPKISRDRALSRHWDEIKDFVDGTEVIDVFSYESANYYSVDADISGGVVNVIYFSNGGYLYIDAELEYDGSGSGFDYESANWWDVELDMDSYLIDDAISQWARRRGVMIY